MSFKPPADFKQSEPGQLEEDQQNLEMFLIQVPLKFDITQLNGVDYEPGQIMNVGTDESLLGQLSATYQLAASAMQDLDLQPLVKHKNETGVGQSITGHLSVTKSYTIETKPSQYTLPGLQTPGPSRVPMPVGLRERFTPFGSDSPVRGPRHKHPKLQGESTASLNDVSAKKKKKRKRGTEDADLPVVKVEPSVLSNHASPSFSLLETANGTTRSGQLNESLQETEASQLSTVGERHKKKKQKRHKQKREDKHEVDFPSPLTNGGSSVNDSLACGCDEGKNVKVKKQKKNVSFSLENSVFLMNSSGDASLLSSNQMKTENLCDDVQQFQDVNGNSDKPDMVKVGKKRKRSSGYSSADTSLEIGSPNTDDSDTRPAKKKKKKHKAVRDSSP